MSASIGERRSGVTAGVLLLLVAALFAALGKWQLQRERDQRAFEISVYKTRQLPALDLRSASPHAQDGYRSAMVEGIYDGTQQLYIEGKRYQDRAGFHVITPLRINGSRRYVLVNRGWIPARAETAEVPAGRVRINGTLVPAQIPALRLGEPTGPTRPYLDPRDYARATGRIVEPLILVAGEASGGLVPVKVDAISKLGMHTGYALQWFAFAAIAFLFSSGLFVKRYRHGR